MTNRQFAERLNRELDGIEAPLREDERVEAFSKMFHIPKFRAEAILHGTYLPDENLLNAVADEFEINADWLIGKSENRQKKAS
ncbi:MAG: hypothetical protein A3F46_04910 [Legionellales bacterium RIFCSPHIGHO2_12_FULL_42_9]|nr:MAG: hypothetical protein A3F46_04910 [Legionellales bacterium RIFCSPHIGHO2_12_FULL_42_9]